MGGKIFIKRGDEKIYRMGTRTAGEEMNLIPNCRVCNADKSTQFIRADFVFGGTAVHKFWECKNCGLVYLYPIPSEEDEAIFYTMEFEKFMASRSGGDRDWTGPEAHIRTNQDHIKRRWKFLEKYLSKGKKLLEIGCSSGFMLDAFQDNGLDCYGIEPSGIFKEYLKQRNYKIYQNWDELKICMPDLKFDLIVHFFVLEHIRNTKLFIEQQLNILNDDGVIIVEVPSANDPLTSFYKIPAFEKFYWSIAHHYYFNVKSLSYILDRINCLYEFIPEQRYDLSNHIVWMQDGKPGGQGKFNHIFSKKTLESYSDDLKEKSYYDTLFLYIKKRK